MHQNYGQSRKRDGSDIYAVDKTDTWIISRVEVKPGRFMEF